MMLKQYWNYRLRTSADNLSLLIVPSCSDSNSLFHSAYIRSAKAKFEDKRVREEHRSERSLVLLYVSQQETLH